MMQIAFVSPQKGYVVALFGKIVQTSDGGATWQVTSPQQTTGYNTIAAAGGSVYVGGQGEIIKSTNGGATWAVLPNSPADILSMYFTDANHGIAFGSGNYSGGDFGHSYASMYTTSDGGQSWQGSADISDYVLIENLSFPDNGTIGYALSGTHVIRIQLK